MCNQRYINDFIGSDDDVQMNLCCGGSLNSMTSCAGPELVDSDSGPDQVRAGAQGTCY